MNSFLGGGGFDVRSSDTAPVPTEEKREGVVPMVIRQIHESPDDGPELFGMRFGVVSLVAILRKIDYTSTKITYHLEDHSGQISAHFWLDEDVQSSSPNVTINTYVRVYGSVRNQGGTKTIMAFKIRDIESINEYTTYLLEVLEARYKSEHFKKTATAAIYGNGNENGTGFEMNWSGTGAGAVTQMNTDSVCGLTGKQLAVFKAIQANASDEGVHIGLLQQKFNHMSKSDLQEILNNLIQEAHIYTTVDNDHFATTDV